MPLCFLRASGKVGSFISVSIVILGVAALFQTHIGGVSLAIESDVSERICDGVSVPEASCMMACSTPCFTSGYSAQVCKC